MIARQPIPLRWVWPMAITLLLWISSRNEVTLWQVTLGFLILVLPWCAYTSWQRNGTNRLPLFAIVALAHWVYFGLPLFWSSRNIDALVKQQISDGAITRVLEMTLLGLACLWAGMRLRFFVISPSRLPDVAMSGGRRDYMHFVMACGLVLSLVVSPYVLGEGGRQIVLILQSVVPAAIFAILFSDALKGQAGDRDIVMIILYLVISVILGAASGWAGSLARVGILCSAVFLSVRRKIPWLAIVGAGMAVVFLQVGKTPFREAYWYGSSQGDPFERISFWVEQSYSRWADAIVRADDDQIFRYANQTLERASLLNQAANVMERTPSVVPFQHGRTYSYMAVTLIPRFLWPAKPDVNEANRFYQVQYGLSSTSSVRRVSISAGFLVEGYMNFGWAGVVGVMFLVGVVLGIIEQTFFSREGGVLWTSLGIALLTPLITIESQFVQYLGGFVQQVLLTLLILLPAATYGARQPDISRSSLVESMAG